MKQFVLLLTVLMIGTCVLGANPEPTEKKSSNSTVKEEKEMVIESAAVTDAMREFKSLSRVDRKMRIKEAKAAIKEFKAQKASGGSGTPQWLLIVLAILLPPLAVALHENGINGKFWLSILLTLLFWIPGVIYALIVVLS